MYTRCLIYIILLWYPLQFTGSPARKKKLISFFFTSKVNRVLSVSTQSPFSLSSSVVLRTPDAPAVILLHPLASACNPLSIFVVLSSVRLRLLYCLTVSSPSSLLHSGLGGGKLNHRYLQLHSVAGFSNLWHRSKFRTPYASSLFLWFDFSISSKLEFLLVVCITVKEPGYHTSGDGIPSSEVIIS